MNDTNLYIDEILSRNQADIFGDNWEILCVNKGETTVTKGSAVYKLNVGDTVFFAPNEFHNICENDDTEYILIGFIGRGEFLEELSEKVVSLTESEMQLIKRADELNNNPQKPFATEQSLAMLKLLLLLCCEKESNKSCKDKNASVFSFAAEVLKENIRSNISVSELAERLDLSLSNLKRIFLKYTGIGVHEYYTILKISLAKELLGNGNSVTATAELTGFANQAYFSAAFKRVTGKTPTEYCAVKPKENKPIAKKISTKKADLPSYLL